MRSLLLILLVMSAAAAAAPTAAAQAPPPSTVPAPTPPPDYAYEPDNRRDPFLNLVNRGSEARPATGANRPEGLPGLLVEEVVVRGIVQIADGWVAMVSGPAGRTFTVRTGDRLMDGSVRTISHQAVVLMQDVNDPLSREKQREVRKFLRGEVK
jgi:Tfp pilus assembly protein PilP